MTVSRSSWSLVVVATTLFAHMIGARAQEFDSAYYNDRRAKIEALAAQAPFVVVGTIVRVGPDPAGWSGRFETRQSVIYNVNLALKGNLTPKSIQVNHLVVYGSATARPGNRPGLNPDLFKPDNKLILFVRPMAGGPPSYFDDINEDVGTLQFSQKNLDAMQRILGVP